MEIDLTIPEILRRSPGSKRSEPIDGERKYDVSYRDEPWYKNRRRTSIAVEDEREATIRQWNKEWLAEKRREARLKK